MTKTSDLVERALREYPVTRNSDKHLMMTVWWYQDKEFLSHFKTFFIESAYTPESITRSRRKFQEAGKYPAVQQVNESRYNKFKQMRESRGE